MLDFLQLNIKSINEHKLSNKTYKRNSKPKNHFFGCFSCLSLLPPPPKKKLRTLLVPSKERTKLGNSNKNAIGII